MAFEVPVYNVSLAETSTADDGLLEVRGGSSRAANM
jgi:hypothetical protein